MIHFVIIHYRDREGLEWLYFCLSRHSEGKILVKNIMLLNADGSVSLSIF